MKSYSAKLKTPFAVLGVVTGGETLQAIDFLPRDASLLAPRDALAEETRRQLQAYLAQPGFRFDLPLNPRGTPYRQRVWQVLLGIPSGATRCYGDIAEELGSAALAVGQACGANPLPLVIPCHRVLARHGLGGFMHRRDGDALDIKRWLLEHERQRPSAA
ncbi:MAG: methylated-DNA--[protein]-cysteine S-methyltransferase [Sulfuricellaceae bacterium]|nr:methylated-DNA--[protein]-cysteine S-methyltransferase [Sulfuricellaceae bacterium]